MIRYSLTTYIISVRALFFLLLSISCNVLTIVSIPHIFSEKRFTRTILHKLTYASRRFISICFLPPDYHCTCYPARKFTVGFIFTPFQAVARGLHPKRRQNLMFCCSCTQPENVRSAIYLTRLPYSEWLCAMGLVRDIIAPVREKEKKKMTRGVFDFEDTVTHVSLRQIHSSYIQYILRQCQARRSVVVRAVQKSRGLDTARGSAVTHAPVNFPAIQSEPNTTRRAIQTNRATRFVTSGLVFSSPDPETSSP